MVVKDRYSRQIVLQNIQESGQEKLAKSHVVIIGCGALGTTIANNLVRSGIGHIKMTLMATVLILIILTAGYYLEKSLLRKNRKHR